MDLVINPNVAYLLLVLAFLLTMVAVATPGTGLVEVGALVTLVLAVAAIVLLPINAWALAILFLGAVLFAIAVRRARQLGYLVLSLACFVIGSAFLFQGQGLVPAVNPVLALAVSVVSVGALWTLATKSIEASQTRPAHDLEALIGMSGEARTEIGREGSVYVDGELWTAISDAPVPAGTRIRVVGREGLALKVAAADPPQLGESPDD